MNTGLSWMYGAALLLLAGAAPAAQMVVVASTVPGIGPGKVVDGAAKIEVPAGATVTLINQAGNTVRLEGPYASAPGNGAGKGGGDPKLLAALSKLAKGSGKETGTIGAMRSAGSGAPSDPWSIDVTRTGVHCFSRDGELHLWRDRTHAASQLTASNLAGGGRVRTAWPAGQASLAWPAALPLTDGASYMARIKGRSTAAKLRMRALPDDLPSDAHRAAWMAEHGCESQARRLLGMK